jgi:hypothetical protein
MLRINDKVRVKGNIGKIIDFKWNMILVHFYDDDYREWVNAKSVYKIES